MVSEDEVEVVEMEFSFQGVYSALEMVQVDTEKDLDLMEGELGRVFGVHAIYIGCVQGRVKIEWGDDDDLLRIYSHPSHVNGEVLSLAEFREIFTELCSDMIAVETPTDIVEEIQDVMSIQSENEEINMQSNKLKEAMKLAGIDEAKIASIIAVFAAEEAPAAPAPVVDPTAAKIDALMAEIKALKAGQAEIIDDLEDEEEDDDEDADEGYSAAEMIGIGAASLLVAGTVAYAGYKIFGEETAEAFL